VAGTSLYVVPAPGRGARALARDAAGIPVWLTSGRILFDSRESTREAIETVTPLGRGEHTIVRSAATFRQPPTYESLAWAPDGRRLAFLRSSVRDDLEIASVDGRSAPLVARGAASPTWSSDSRWVAFQGRGIA